MMKVVERCILRKSLFWNESSVCMVKSPTGDREGEGFLYISKLESTTSLYRGDDNNPQKHRSSSPASPK